MLSEFKPPAGIVNDGTAYSARGAWNDCDKVRFRGQFPERIGGWAKLNSSVFDGVCRSLIQWADLDGVKHIGVGTHLKYYVENSDGVLNNVTPLRAVTLGTDPIATTGGSTTTTITHPSHGLVAGNRVWISGVTASIGGSAASVFNGLHTITSATTDTYSFVASVTHGSTATGGGSAVTVEASADTGVLLGADPFSVTSGSATVTVSHTAHGGLEGDYVTFSGAAAVGGITISGEYQIVTASTNTYTITHTSAASSTATGGGSAVFAKYAIHGGNENYSSGIGWGSGAWGSSAWSRSPTSIDPEDRLRIWTADAFGEDILICPRGGGVYLYDTSVGGRARHIATSATALDPVLKANSIMVNHEDRRVIAFGCNAVGETTIDPLLIRWSDNEDVGNWQASDITNAGELRISTGSEIIAHCKARGRILVWTDSSLTSMQFVEDFGYGLSLLSPSTDIISPMCVATADEFVFWMGRENFFIYDGQVKTMPCAVRQHVFGDINLGQTWKIHASTNRAHREVWWFYPSADSSEIDRYVIYNYAENVWYYGTLARTAWSDAGILRYPVAAGSDGYLYYHEYGLDDGSTSPASAISAYIKSGPIQLGEGHQFTFVNRFIPDVTFDESSAAEPAVTFSMQAQAYPGGAQTTAQEKSVERGVTTPIERFTTKKDVRLRGRQFIVSISSDGAGVFWRLGIQRFDVRPDGRR